MIRLGRWQDVLADVATCDAVICDPPYGARTHDSSARDSGRLRDPDKASKPIDYAPFSPDLIDEFVASWSPRTSGWMVALTSHDLIPSWHDRLSAAGRYVFAPIACVLKGNGIRLAGDGPANWTIYAVVARPRTREAMAWGSLPGAYVGPPSREAGGGRGKPDWLMRALVGDYSRPGDLVVDPFAGWGSTIAAALGLDRRAIGAEMDPAAHAEAMRRLRRGQQRDLFAGAVA